MIRIPAASKEVVDGETGIKITISARSFLMSSTEVTQAEFEALMGSNPSVYRGANRPVENVSWWDAIGYANRKSAAENLKPCYDLSTGNRETSCTGYRLPTDAEWEFASKGGDGESAHLGLNSTKRAEDVARLVREVGTRVVGKSKPNAFGVFDMLGNVWEWTGDYFNPQPNSPQQAGHGIARIIRGGSFVSTRTRWAGGYRSSMDPNHKGRYTGFRLCRSIAEKAAPEPFDFTVFQKPPAGYETSTGNLSALPGNRESLRSKWRDILGAPDLKPAPPEVRLIESRDEFDHRGKLLWLRTEPDSWEKIYVMTPQGASTAPRPVIIVPYYDVDTPAGVNMGGRSFMAGGVRAYAKLAVQRGFIAVAIRWFGESYGERYDEAVANLKVRHPNCTGLGKWVWDAQRLVDYLYTLPDVDRGRIGIIGHSLGAKMALYAAAMDDRIKAVVFSEGGIGFKMSNYEDYWYLGEKLAALPAGTDQHELMALTAPRPFLLIGGDEYDGPQSWHYINAAKAVYRELGKPDQIGYFNHHSGHSPTAESIGHAMRWLGYFLGEP